MEECGGGDKEENVRMEGNDLINWREGYNDKSNSEQCTNLGHVILQIPKENH